MSIGAAPFSWFSEVPGAAGYMFEVVFAGVSLAIVWGAMAERTKLYVYIVFGVLFTLIYSVASHWIWSPDGWLFSKGMQDFAGSTVVHYQGALAGLAGALLLGPRIGKYGQDGKPNAIPGHNMAYTTLGVIILWFGWFGFNPGSTLSVDFGGLGFFAYVALNTNIAAAAGVARRPRRVVDRDQEAGHLDDAERRDRRARRDHCRLRVRRPWAAIVIGFVAGVIVVFGVLFVERVGIDDPIGAVAAHGMSGVWGTLSLGFLTLPSQAKSLATGSAGLFYGGGFHQLGVQALGLVAVGAFTFTASFAILFALKKTCRAPGRRRGRDRRAGRPRARHVGLSRVLHPGSGRVRDGVALASRRAPATPAGRRDGGRHLCTGGAVGLGLLRAREERAASFPRPLYLTSSPRAE